MNRLRPILLSLSLLLAATGTWAAQLSATDVLKRSYAAESRSTFTGHLRTTLHLRSGSASADVNVFRNGPRSRMEYVGGPSAGNVVIDDGGSLIRLDDSARIAYISATPDAPEHLRLLLANYRPVLERSAKVADRACYVLRLVPKHKGNPSKKLWIDKTSLVPLKTDRYDSDGKLATSTKYTKIDFSARPSPSLFAIPHGWETIRLAGESGGGSLASVRKAVGFAPVKPRYVPKGYVFGGYHARRTRRSVLFAGLRYSNGLNTISVFERKGTCPGLGRGRGWGRRRRNEGWGGGSGVCLLAQNPQARMLRVRTGDFTIVLVGDIAEKELQKMAESFK